MFGLGPMELMIIGGLGVVLFGKRLPEVGMSLGKSIVAFKKGVQGLGEDVEHASTSRPRRSETLSDSERIPDGDDRDEATAPKFEPPVASG